MTVEEPNLSADAQAAEKANSTGRAIVSAHNPNSRVDYLVRLKGATPDNAASVLLCYVPDKLVIREEDFRAYLSAIEDVDGSPCMLEKLALKVLSDLNDELVPRWLQVTVAATEDSSHVVLVEDSQPKWDNPTLLSRAGGI